MKGFTFSQIAGGIIVPVLVVALGLGAYFVLLPQYREVAAARQTVAEKESEQRARQESFEKAKVLVAEYERKQSELSVLDEAIPSAPEIPELLSNIEYLASQSGLLIGNLQIIPAETLSGSGAGRSATAARSLEEILQAADAVRAMDIQAVFKGQYINLKAFFLNLEQNLRIMNIKELMLGEIDPESGVQEYTFTIQTYYQTQ